MLIDDTTIESAAIAMLAADHPEACGWSGKPAEVKERYRAMARAGLNSAVDALDDDSIGAECSRLEDDILEIHDALERIGFEGAINAPSIIERIERVGSILESVRKAVGATELVDA